MNNNNNNNNNGPQNGKSWGTTVSDATFGCF
jgi:hypothetical protein